MKQKKKISFSFIHMGAPSLLMIFLVLCLFTFALLSLSSAKNNRTLSQQSADRIQALSGIFSGRTGTRPDRYDSF